ASTFNYQFSDFPSYHTVGSITPVLLTGGGSNFTPVAVGDPIAFAGPTGFVSSPFGGADMFTLAGSTTLYGGLYWHVPPPLDGLDDRMPVGFENDAGSAFV